MAIRTKRTLALALAGGVWFVGCSESTPTPTGATMAAAPGTGGTRAAATDNTPPTVTSVSLDPSRPQPGTVVKAQAAATDADGDTVHVRYEWHVANGRISGGSDGSLSVPELPKDSDLTVSAIASDGRAESEPATASVRIGNRQPAVTGVRFEPTDGIKPGEIVVAVADGEDLDGDQLDFRYEWRVGDAVQSGDTERFDTSKLKRGDRITVRVTATDGDDESPTIESAYLELGNSAPQIVSTPTPGMGADGVYHYAVEAKDPDGDRNLRFKLTKAPDGAKIDPLLGEITWKPILSQAGKHEIEVVVTDGRSGEAKQTFEVTVREVVDSKSAAAPPAAPSP